MALTAFIKQTVTTTGAIGIAILGHLTLSAPVQGMTIDFGAWTPVSDPISSTSSNILISGQGATLLTRNSVDNFEGGLEAALGLDPNDYPLNAPPGSIDPADYAYQGSALMKSLNAGDTLEFNWTFNQFSGDEDYAFILFNGVKEVLANSNSSNRFLRTFNTAGNFSIGVVDIGDYSGNSELTISNNDLTPIPTPSLLPGLIGFGIGAFRKYRAVDAGKQSAKN